MAPSSPRKSHRVPAAMRVGALNGSHSVVQTAQVCRRPFIYARPRYETRISMAGGKPRTDFAYAFSKALGLPRTAALIVGALARARRSLAVDELVRRVRSSERSVRENLRILLRRGILIRKVFVTANKKLAYAYSLGSIESLVAAARRDVTRTLARIEAVARRFRETAA